jgi:hypothetical protein
MAAMRMSIDVQRVQRRVVVGIDIGQQRDPTAIAVAEYLKRPREDRPERDEWYFPIRHLERLPLGTDYPVVAARVVEVVANIQERARRHEESTPRINVVVDATGVGRPVVDIVRVPLKDLHVPLTDATFTYGENLVGEVGRYGQSMSIGKAYLVSRLQALFQTGRVQLPANHPEAAALTKELLDYEIRVDPEGSDKYGAFKTGAHDDLVTALGLSVIQDPVARGGGAV